MEQITLRELAIPLIKSIDTFNYLLRNHHRRVAALSYYLGLELGVKGEDFIHLVVAASMHDIGALSVVERDSLLATDVYNPKPHCEMGYKMLKPFDIFKKVADIIKHHHIRYDDSLEVVEDVPFQSFIIHLADRIDIILDQDACVLDQKEYVIDEIAKRVGSTFHPKVYEAFLRLSKKDIFWIESTYKTIDDIFDKIGYQLEYQLTLEAVTHFSEVMARIVDYRSGYTVHHSYVVAKVAQYMGNALSRDYEFGAKLYVAGLLHDIGKIAINPDILEKPGKLTSTEYNYMKLHPYFSEQILMKLGNHKWFKDIIKWVAYHHERIDGSGYPYGLKESEIDLATKILAFSDIISALSEDRPYRGRMTHEQIMSILGTDSLKISIHIFEWIEKHEQELFYVVDMARDEIDTLD